MNMVSNLFGFCLRIEHTKFSDILQSSASVQPLPGKTQSRKEILLQGDVSKHISEFLTSTYGLGPQQISFQSKNKASR